MSNEVPMRSPPRRDTPVHFLIGAAVLLFAGASASGAPFSLDTTPGRLPKDIVPCDYTVDLTPDAAAFSITGHVGVVLEFRKASATIEFDSVNEMLSSVTLNKPAPLGRHTLSFSYTGKLEQALRSSPDSTGPT